jgi:myo-inositol-1(or 4)-monophosphatase
MGQLLRVRHKSGSELVTEIDEASEEAVVEVIRRDFPSHRILAEEGSVGGDDPRHRWIVDPLDGTTNYANGLPIFCVSVGFEIDGDVAAGAIYDPVREELFAASSGDGARLNGRRISVSQESQLSQSLLTTGFPYDSAQMPAALRQFSQFSQRARAVRRLGSAALDLAYVAAGRFDGYWEAIVSPWDMAAGIVIVREAGGLVTTMAGQPRSNDVGDLLATNGRIHQEMLRVLASEPAG